MCSYITAPDWKTYVLYGMSFVSWGANIELNPKYMTFKLQTKDIEYIKKQTKNIPTISQAQVFCSMSITPPCQIFRLETPWSTGALPNLENYEFQDSMAFLVFITSKWKICFQQDSIALFEDFQVGKIWTSKLPPAL